MKAKHMSLKSASLVALIVSLTLLPGCMDWIREKFGGQPTEKRAQIPASEKMMQQQMPEKMKPEEMPMKPGDQMPMKPEEMPMNVDEKDVLVWMDGKPLITIDKLKSEKNDLMESNPQLRSMVAFMDEKQLDRNLTDGLTNQAVVDKFVAIKKIDQSKEYQQEMSRMMRSVKHMLNTKFFSQELDIMISDADVKEFYDKNKDSMPNLLVSRGGIKAVGVEFDAQDKAQDFVKKVGEANGDLQKAAESNGMKDKVKDFKLVHNQSLGMDDKLRDEIVKIDTFPTTKVFKVDDKTYWAVSTSGKEDSKYRPLEQIKADLKQFLEKEKRAEMLEKEIDSLKKEYKVVIKEDYFVSEVKDDQAAMKTANVGDNKEEQSKAASKSDSSAQGGAKIA